MIELRGKYATAKMFTMEDIVGNIDPTATIDAVIKPIYNFKAGDDE